MLIDQPSHNIEPHQQQTRLPTTTQILHAEQTVTYVKFKLHQF